MSLPTYADAYTAYEEGYYQQSRSLFEQLLKAFPLESAAWKGFAASCQMQQEYVDAIMAWAFAACLEPNDPVPHIHTAACMLSLKNIDSAKITLETAQTRFPNNLEDLPTGIYNYYQRLVHQCR